MMKHLGIFLYFMLCLSALLPAQNNMIFGGTSGDGYSQQGHAQSTGNDIFDGENDDGYTSGRFSQEQNGAIFLGGNNDGYSSSYFSLDNNNPIFSGGSNDGFATASKSQPSNNDLFKGGTDDGYSSEDFSQKINNDIFNGGEDDGYVCFYLETATPIRLPPILEVEWFDFQAKPNGAAVFLSWKTRREINHSHFNIERSGVLREGILLEEHIPGSGGPSEGAEYQTIDLFPLEGTNYYRLQMVDKNGDVERSNWAEVWFSAKEEIIASIFPNPTQSILNLKVHSNIDQDIHWTITDLFGKTIDQGVFSADVALNRQQIHVGHLAEGAYMLSVDFTAQKRRKVFRFLKSN